MIYVVNDLHGAPNLLMKTINSISNMMAGDSLIINGDGAGARGPIMNNIVKIFYEVRRGESDVSRLKHEIKSIIGEYPEIPNEWIFNSVHAGMFRKLMAARYPDFRDCMHNELNRVIEDTLTQISAAAAARSVKVYYAPGNGETVPDDLLTDDIAVEHAVAPQYRFYQKLAKDGLFKKYNIEYVEYAEVLPSGVLVLSSNLLDLPEVEAMRILRDQHILEKEHFKVIVHYPPTIAPIGKAFTFWNPNRSDSQRIEALGIILSRLRMPLQVKRLYFGHIHLGANDQRMEAYPSTMGFMFPGGWIATWVKPGEVLPVV